MVVCLWGVMVDSPPFDRALWSQVSFPHLWKNLWKSKVFGRLSL